MGKFNSIQASFSLGEISPRAIGRSDLKDYYQALEVCENFIPQKQGGVIKRPGTSFVLDISTTVSGSGDPVKMIPFVFSQEEAFSVVLFAGGAGDAIKIYSNDGVEQQIVGNYIDSSFFSRSGRGFKFAQSGDILIIGFDESEDIPADTVKFPIIAIIRQRDGRFFAFAWGDPIFQIIVSTGALPIIFPRSFKFSPAVYFPYLPANVDPGLRFYVNTVSTGTGRILTCVNVSNVPIPYFTEGHVFKYTGVGTGHKITQMGAYFKITKGTQTGVCWGEVWPSNLLAPSVDINTGTDVVTYVAHGLVTRDVVILNQTGGAGTTDPVITGYTLASGGYQNNTTLVYDVYVRALTVDTLAFYPTEADAVADTNRLNFTSAGDRGLRIQHQKLSSLTVNIEVAMEATLNSAAGASDNWEESSWSNERGFPKAFVFHEQRLFFGGTRRSPDTVWGSMVGNIVNMMQRRLTQDSSGVTTATNSSYKFILSGSILETDPFDITIASKQANIIQWMESQRVLQVGTLGAEYIVDGGDAIISSSSVFVRKQTEIGSEAVDALTVGNSVLFVQRDGRSVRDFKYNDQNGSYTSNNISVLADHMVYKGFLGGTSEELKSIKIDEMYFQPSRECVWFLTSKKQLVAVTFAPDQGNLGWHYHPIRSTDSIRSFCVIPGSSKVFDEIWMVVRRSINGSTRHYLEKMGDDFDHTSLNNQSPIQSDVPIYSDCAVSTILGSVTAVVTGLSHLNGETVKVLAAGVAVPDEVVAGGQITLAAALPIGTRVVVGLPYISRLRTLDIEAGGDFGSAQGNAQRVDRVTMRLYKSQGGTFGKELNGTMDDIEYADTALFTGEKRLFLTSSPDTNTQIEISHSEPTPFNLLSMTYRGVSYD